MNVAQSRNLTSSLNDSQISCVTCPSTWSNNISYFPYLESIQWRQIRLEKAPNISNTCIYFELKQSVYYLEQVFY